ncbi:hypothetical protein BASA82_000256 [Batrachochytrium salamandrivorans]|nr:hypothetical protein BASA82_000256 [Batrachochytrium salamandrivorans]
MDSNVPKGFLFNLCLRCAPGQTGVHQQMAACLANEPECWTQSPHQFVPTTGNECELGGDPHDQSEGHVETKRLKSHALLLRTEFQIISGAGEHLVAQFGYETQVNSGRIIIWHKPQPNSWLGEVFDKLNTFPLQCDLTIAYGEPIVSSLVSTWPAPSTFNVLLVRKQAEDGGLFRVYTSLEHHAGVMQALSSVMELTNLATVLDSRRTATQVAPNDEESAHPGWRKQNRMPSVPETFNSVSVAPEDAPWWRKLRSFTGLGFLVAVGYMDPGNWATDVAGGSKYGYDLLFVILCASLAAMFLQFLSIKLGVATGRDLAQACRDSFHPKVVLVLWVIMELAMIATDMAELLGAAIALYLLTGLPLPAGVVIMGIDVLFILVLQQRRLRLLESMVMMLTGLIFSSLLYVVILAQPNMQQVMLGFVPKSQLFTNPSELFVGISILGATVMPHNLFLHSSMVQSRKYARTIPGKQYATKYAAIDSSMSLTLAFFINAFILVAAAAAFSGQYSDTEDIFQAYDRLSVALGTNTASTMFGVALLASGQQASLTGTMRGQIVMEGFFGTLKSRHGSVDL